MECVKCRKVNPPGSRFCIFCGSNLPAPQVEQPSPLQDASVDVLQRQVEALRGEVHRLSTVVDLINKRLAVVERARPALEREQPARVDLSPPAEIRPVVRPVPTYEEGTPVITIPPLPRPSLFATSIHRMRELLMTEEWEAVIGGSWLNKLGVLVLVIGLSLFLGYSLTHLGPPGRVAVGLAVSGAMLAGGVVLERRARYVVFARGLIGGGWAALYVTTYAMHALEAARIVHDPLIGMMLLGAVAAGMILHSLHYRSEVVTGLAYFVGYVTILISPVSGFARFASIPLAASLLFVAYRFSWLAMAVGGIVGTYGTYALRYGVESVTGSLAGDLISGQAVLAVYWLLFEGLDLLDAGRRRERPQLAQTLFPLNACGFIGVSLLQWASPTTLYLFFAAAGGAYLASTLVRARIRPPSGFPEEADPLTRALRGGYEGAVTLAVALTTIGIFLRFSGLKTNVTLLLQAEFLFLAGLSLAQPYLRGLAAVILAMPVIKLAAVDALGSGQVPVLGIELKTWVPLAVLTAAVLYLNRGLVRPDPSPLLLLERGYSYVASALLALVLAVEVPLEHLGLGWLVLALPLFELGFRQRLAEFRLQSYGIGTLGFAVLIAVNGWGAGLDAVRHPWVSLGLPVLLMYLAAARFFRLPFGSLPEQERLGLRDAGSIAGTALLAALLWHVLPTPVVAVGWGILSLLLIELGFSLPFPLLRAQGHLVAALAFGRLFLANFTGTGETLGISHRILSVLPVVLLLYYLWARLRVEGGEGQLAAWERRVSGLYLYAPVLLVVVLIRFEVGRVLAVVGWALFGLGLLISGIRWKNQDLRWQSYALALPTFLRSWTTNFYIPESLVGIFGRVVTGAIVIGSFYAAQLIAPRRQDTGPPLSANRLVLALVQVDRNARAVFSILATVLLTVLLLYEVSGRLLTVAWGLEGAALLTAGFSLRERVLRLSGLLLLGVCVVKVFVYDLRELDIVFRILSFIVLGVVLLAASLIYTRFRGQLRRYL